jgi:hypothetical protein
VNGISPEDGHPQVSSRPGVKSTTSGRSPPTTVRKTKTLNGSPMTGIDICRMMKRRLEAARLLTDFSHSSFRVTAVTDLLQQNVAL